MRPADSTLSGGLTPFEMRKPIAQGRVLRIEVFDADANSLGNPYSVTGSFSVQRLQGFGPNRHASFLVTPETVTLQYERSTSDPRVGHEAVLETNAYGDVLRALSIGYPRRAGPSPEPALDAATRGRLAYDQSRLHMRGFARTDTNAIDDIVASPDNYRTPRAAAAALAEITGVSPKDKGFGAASLFALTELDGPPAAPGIWQTVWSGGDVPMRRSRTPMSTDRHAAASPPPFLAKTHKLSRRRFRHAAAGRPVNRARWRARATTRR